MGGYLVRRESSSIEETRHNAKVWHILYEGGLDRFMNACKVRKNKSN